jgi:hypothetical protein
MDNVGEWLTYVAAAKRLNRTRSAIRQMAIRGKIQRVRSNDGKALIFVTPDMVRVENEQPERSESVHPVSSTPEPRPNHELVHAIKALRDQLTTAVERETRLVAQLAGAEARAEKQAVEFAARDAERRAMLTAEQARTTQAIAAFESLATRLEALAEARRPWWRRLHMTG